MSIISRSIASWYSVLISRRIRGMEGGTFGKGGSEAMEHQDQNIEWENAQSATDSPRRATRDLWGELLKTIVFMLAALAVIVIGCMAWFAANHRVHSGLASVSSKDVTIRLATKGVRQTSEKNLLNLDAGILYEHDGKTYYRTNNNKIALRLSDQYVVSPGASGVVTFYIIPTQDGASEITLYVNLAGYVGSGTQASPVDDPVLNALLSGHILLFQEHEGGHYSGWLSGGLNNAITVSLPEDTKENEPQEVTIYWIWPLRYENMINDLYSADNTDVDSTEEKNRFDSFVEAQSTTGLIPISDESNYRYSRIFLTRETSLSKVDSRSAAYNLADEYIGSNAQYLYLSIQTTPYRDESAE